MIKLLATDVLKSRRNMNEFVSKLTMIDISRIMTATKVSSEGWTCSAPSLEVSTRWKREERPMNKLWRRTGLRYLMHYGVSFYKLTYLLSLIVEWKNAHTDDMQKIIYYFDCITDDIKIWYDTIDFDSSRVSYFVHPKDSLNQSKKSS